MSLYLQRFFRMINSNRMLPDFIIIGGRRCGSTSLFNYLSENPSIGKSLRKEIHFFSTKQNKSIRWYKSHFPSIREKNSFIKKSNKQFICGEASPHYLSHPLAPLRIKKILPKVKMIVLLRDPVERAYSDFKHSDKETLSFEEALENEPIRLFGEEEKIKNDPKYISILQWNFAYATQGIYVKQIQNWLSYFPLEQFLFLRSEDLFLNPSEVLKNVYQFLGLEYFELKNYKKYNATDSSKKMKTETKIKLYDFFRNYNTELEELIGKKFYWNDNYV